MAVTPAVVHKTVCFCLLNYNLNVDGNFGGSYHGDGCTHTLNTPSPGEWWVVDLQDVYAIGRVSVTNRDATEGTSKAVRFITLFPTHWVLLISMCPMRDLMGKNLKPY